MGLLTKAFAALLLAASVASPSLASPAAPEVVASGMPVDLTPDTYASAVEGASAILVEFWAPWCGKCKAIKKEYERAAELAAREGLPVTIARVDTNKYDDFAKGHGVKAVPTFFLYVNGTKSAEPFPMLTTGEAYVAGLSKVLGLGLDLTPAKVFGANESPLDVATWLFWRGASDGRIMTTLILYRPAGLPETPSDVVFTSVAKDLMRFSNLRFAICENPAVMEDFGIPTDAPSLVLYTDHDEGRHIYSGALDHEALRSWVLLYDVPMVEIIWHGNLQAARRRVQTLGLFYLNEAQSDDVATTNRIIQGLKQVAYALVKNGVAKRGDFTLGVTDGKKYKTWKAHFGFPADAYPVMSLENTTSGARWVVPDFSIPAASFPEPGSKLPSYMAGRPYTITEAPLPEGMEELVAGEAAREGSATLVGADGSMTPATTEASPTPSYAPLQVVTYEQETDPDPRKMPPLTWVDVPVDVLVASLTDYFNGKGTPAPVTDKGAAPWGA